MLDNFLVYTITDNGSGTKKGKIFIKPERFKIQYKTIVSEGNVKYEVILPYTLLVIERKVKKQLNLTNSLIQEHIIPKRIQICSSSYWNNGYCIFHVCHLSKGKEQYKTYSNFKTYYYICQKTNKKIYGL
ncbi:hypothetical protein AGMMS5026_10250 [Endomicrobiia bacterium]|uniref:Uncharacterized protein n=1 Tax=Endomicrobium trichonymphae TaxID=1408204 RepID=B1H0D6_ENDTX|nr:hypothetical protein [Candidatus Endomicrobium trichonymphae]GHT04213.1 hypothetical protein AGMMS49523_01350 [Endomicrobiia bacterium]BAG13968.1 hypothetical protein TGRD_480 [Candidatus Endomicrobium trichonymphae]GHT10817.1 hypothetical protein AGMMS49571_00080 [Endomicrobiia bacterium]GHT20767.1 hypothetical protein AGMMS49929_08260 [Endomicrobiia bacterium]GHT25954.1 hypothetical protein AGMMS49995_01360 [Endomicrobiia bacterium]